MKGTSRPAPSFKLSSPFLSISTAHGEKTLTAPRTPSMKFKDDRFDPRSNNVNDMVAVLDNQLYIGNSSAAKSTKLLSAHGVTMLIDCSDDLLETTIKYHRIELKDNNGEDISKYFDSTNSIIRDEVHINCGRVLVYCTAGISRSVALVIAYLIKESGMTLRQAFLHVHQKRCIIAPNLRYFDALIRYEIETTNQSTMSFDEYVMYYSGAATIDQLKQGHEVISEINTPFSNLVHDLTDKHRNEYETLVQELLKIKE
ncbi:dual specificity protein phosphatase [Acrasis kona]|uniref:protein-tyrosine-phosphatase n=1 Tax=Acrasis kona TaxID=1008807 RepID=A0AAW2Z5Q4_9EUKA